MPGIGRTLAVSKNEDMELKNEENIINSWNQNAKAWLDAIQKNEIESRILTTNKIIIDTILEKEPKKVLDVGCGEGWLSRALSNLGINVLGIDAVPELVKEAKRQGGGRFELLSYQELSNGSIKEKFDVVVCNFSLLGNESVNTLFGCLTDLLKEDGFLIIQTLHPFSEFKGYDYKDGWRKGTWTGFSDKFTNPPPWYFRTLATWKHLFHENSIDLGEIIESRNPKTQSLASIVFVGKLREKHMGNLNENWTT